MSKVESMARVSAAYLLALGTATAWLVWGPDTDRLWLDALIADDPYWSVLPPYLAVYWAVASDGGGAGSTKASARDRASLPSWSPSR